MLTWFLRHHSKMRAFSILSLLRVGRLFVGQYPETKAESRSAGTAHPLVDEKVLLGVPCRTPDIGLALLPAFAMMVS